MMKPFAICMLLLAQAAGHVAFAQKIDVYARPLRAERSRDYDVLHYRIKLRFDEAQKTFWGENTITLKPLAENFSTCVLDAELLKVTRVADAQAQPLAFVQDDSSIAVTLARVYHYGDTLAFTVSYVSVNPQPEAKKYGMAPDYNLGLDFKAATPDNPQLINTLSFPEGARHWFPCNDQPNDKATNELLVTVRQEYSAISNGRLLSVQADQQNATKTFHWSQEQPHSTYLFVLAAGPYVMLKDSLGTLPINYWVYPNAVPEALRSFHRTPEIIAFFEREFGYKYPWAKYDQITIPGIGGGAESTSATVVGQSTIHDARAEQDFPSHWLVAHEAAHQWWGDLVTMRTWSQTWINESFATYGEYLYSRHLYGEDEGALNLEDKKNTYLREARERYQRPIVFERYIFPNDNFDSHTYPKGAAVLHMLRWLLGEQQFQRVLAYFLHQHAFQAVDTYQFMTAIKAVTGQNLDWFFEQWLFRAGHPIFEVSYTWEENTQKLHLNIKQTQQTSETVPIFKTPVNLALTTAAGKTSQRVWLDEKEEHFELDCATAPLLVRFDAGNYLLKELTFKKSAAELLYQLQHDDVIGRMWAATELKNFTDRAEVIAALQSTALADSFWAVRRSAVEVLGGLQRTELVAFLKKKCADRKSRVRVAALKALGDLQQRGLVKFFEERFAREDSYLAQAEALRALGKCGDKAALPLLQRAAAMKSPRQVLRTAAEAARQMLEGQ